MKRYLGWAALAAVGLAGVTACADATAPDVESPYSAMIISETDGHEVATDGSGTVTGSGTLDTSPALGLTNEEGDDNGGLGLDAD